MSAAKYSPEFKAHVSRLWAEGYSRIQIAELLGISKDAVIGLVHRLKLPPRGNPVRQGTDTRRNAIELRAKGATLRVIAQALNRNPNDIKRMFESEDRKRPIPAPTPALPAVETPRMATIKTVRQVEMRLPASPHRTCQFITSADKPWRFCCRQALFGKSWCAQHYRVVFTPASRKEAA